MAETSKSPIDKGKIRVFVYGTLKQGHGNHILLKSANAIFLGYDSITGPYRMCNMGAFPALLDNVGDLTANNIMRGEVWAMDPEGLAALDLLEGNPVFYCRRKLWTDTLRKRVWVYFLTNAWNDEANEEDVIPDALWNPKDEERNHWTIKCGVDLTQ